MSQGVKSDDGDYEIPESSAAASSSSGKREDGEAAEALLLLSANKKQQQQHGDKSLHNGHSSRKIKPDPDQAPVACSSSSANGSSSAAKKNKKVKAEDNEDEDVKKQRNKRQKIKAEDDEEERPDSTEEDDFLEKKSKKAPKPPAKKSTSKKKSQESDYDDDEESDYEDERPARKKSKTALEVKGKNGRKSRAEEEKASFTSKKKSKVAHSPASSTAGSPKKRKKDEEEEIWKWWEDPDHQNDEIKWKTLSHKGPVFAPAYEPLPDSVKFRYDGKVMKLSKKAEEVGGFYGRMIEHDYTTKEVFNKNFFKDWRKMMSAEERATITDLKKCDFTQINDYYKEQSEKRKQRSKEDKKKDKEDNVAQVEEFGFCMIDGHKEKIGNFKIEPPGLFRGRGEHPKMGMLKRRVEPEDVIINCSKGNEPKPPPGHKWKEVRHDNRVTWLACWTENILGSNKYIMLNPSSKLKGQKDMKKYEVARKLKKEIVGIRETYKTDWKSKEMKIRQRAVALYFIDKLALRAGNEKEEGETADTVGCCSLRVEHLKLHDEVDGKKYVVDFDFLGKDSIRYQNRVSVEKRVFKNLKLFMQNKSPEDDVFDRLNTTTLNKHLSELMEGLTAKVFRTYNASITLQDQLEKLTSGKDLVAGKMLSYNRANRAVAVLCNHQRSIPKTFDKQMDNVKAKIKSAEERVSEAKKALKDLKKADPKNKKGLESAQSKVDKAKEALHKLEISATDKEENKTIALGTSKLNYLDPRISVAWCKKNEVPIEKVYNKTQRAKFRWAIDMAGPDFVF